MKQYVILNSRDFPANGTLPANTSGTIVDAEGGTRLDRVHLRKFDAEGKQVPATGTKPGTIVTGVFVVTPPFHRSVAGANGAPRQMLFETGPDGKPILDEHGNPTPLMSAESRALILIGG